jgi:NADP-dependent 3-hydroxy acid dehydrogenase YdfG
LSQSRQQSPNKAVAVVSGASAGIGVACAEILAEHGYAVALGARRQDRLEALATRLTALGAPEVFCAPLDVTDDASTEAFARAVTARFGRVDVLVNNAGLAIGVDSVADGKPADWELMLATNVTGLLRLTKLFLPGMIARDAGHIVNMGSIAGHYTYAGGSAYAGSKHAVKAITGALRLELSGKKIRVSSVDPGMVETEFSQVRLGDEKKAKAVYQGMTPLTARDIAECIYFAVSRPPHVNVDHIIVMPTAQAAISKVHRE